jgi:tyrosyl-tRNA synthetase
MSSCKSNYQDPQCILTVPILEGLDGVQKMSKSLDNYIAVEDNPRDMFGKTMRVSDELMFRYYELLTDITVEELQKLQADVKSGAKHPRAVKVELGRILVERFHSSEAAANAVAEFDRIFVNKGLPDEIPDKQIAAAAQVAIAKLMVDTGLAASNGEARRLIEGKAVERDGKKIEDPQMKLDLKSGESFVLKAGKKKFVRVQVT